MKIGLIGAGRLGLCLALLIEDTGYDVLASDIRPDYVKDLNEKKYNGSEPDINYYLEKANNIHFTTDNIRVISECDIIFTLVATPSLEDGSYDVSAVWKVVEDFKTAAKETEVFNKSLVIGCTTNPGDCDQIYEELSLNPDTFGVNVFYNPEFIAQGTIIKDLQNADTVLICGENYINEHEHVTTLKKIYKQIQFGYNFNPSIHYMSAKAGEIVKIAINTFLTTKISYANTIGQVLALSDLDDEIDSVLEAIGNDSRIGKKYLKFGFGFGGPCFPRDNRAFASYANQVGVEFNIGQTTDDFNDEHAKFLFTYFTKKNKNNLPFVFPSVAYKKGTDIIEESQQYRLCLDLLDAGHKVHVLDDSLKDICDDRILYSKPTGYFFNIDL
jgi:nucleotide sugar dehydrogenase